MRAVLIRLLPALALLLATAFPAAALETSAREAILMDATTGTVLMAKDPDRPMPPASMSKIMTAYMVFERLKEGRLSLDDRLPVSERAWRKGGSKMFVEVGDEVRVEDLLRGVIVQSGNDACIVLAEGLSGSEEAFAREMNRKAEEIGLTGSNFRNATGWPDEGHVMTARDLAILAKRLIETFPEYYHYYSERDFTWSDIRQGNRNPLLYRDINADGLKTGHTEEAGYGLTASAVEDGRRLILVVTGLESAQQRADEADRLLRWGFREFTNFRLFETGEMVEDAEVWLGEAARVPLVPDRDVVVTLPHAARDGLEAKVVYEGPIPAPIRAGQRLATLQVTAPEMAESFEVPLYAGADVDRLGVVGRLFGLARYRLFGSL